MKSSAFAVVVLENTVLKTEQWSPQEHLDAEFKYIDIHSIDRVNKTVMDAKRLLGSQAPSRARLIVNEGDVIVSTVRPNLNAVALITKDLHKATASTGFCVLRPDNRKLYSRYLYYFVRHPVFISRLLERATGASYPAVTDKVILESEIPLPPLPVQKKISDILDKADETHRKRQQALRLTDQFLQAAFLQMFGDPVKNPKGWEVRRFGDFINFVTSGSRGWAKYYSDSGAKFIRVQNLTNHKLNLNDMAHVRPPASSETERTRVQPNDILISITGVVGLSAVVPVDVGEAYISQHVALARLKSALNPIFASYFISNRLGGQLQFKKIEYGQTKPGLNLDQIRDIRIYVPPLIEQGKFVALVGKIETFRKKQHQSEQELETLFQSLMQKAFRGDLGRTKN